VTPPSPQSKVKGIVGWRVSTPLTVTVPEVLSIDCTLALKLEDFPKSTLLKLKGVIELVGGGVEGDSVVEVIIGVDV
jgi:hypothetical protein